MHNLDSLSKKLNLVFKNQSLIKNAFIHRSYLNEAKKRLVSNERMEFLGDSILSYLTSEFIYVKFPNLPEGELTNLRSILVKTTTLADIADFLHLGQYLYLSKGEEEGGGRTNSSILADTFEALLGAIYLDQGIDTVKKLLLDILFPKLSDIIKNKGYKDAKSSFQEIVQEKVKFSPVYRIISEQGPDHAKVFTVGVYVEDTFWGKGKGKNKQEAEQEAASMALEKWRKK